MIYLLHADDPCDHTSMLVGVYTSRKAATDAALAFGKDQGHGEDDRMKVEAVKPNGKPTTRWYDLTVGRTTRIYWDKFGTPTIFQ